VEAHRLWEPLANVNKSWNLFGTGHRISLPNVFITACVFCVYICVCMCRVGQNRIYTPYISINVWFWPTLYVCLCVCVSGLACFACIYVCVCVCVRVCVCVSGIMYLHHVCTPLLLFQIPCQGHNQSPDPLAVNTAAYEIMRVLMFAHPCFSFRSRARATISPPTH